MHRVTKELNFCAAHRLLAYGGKCGRLHGHNYKIEVTCSWILDRHNMVIDFSTIKNIVGEWVDENWDHMTILNSEDELRNTVGHVDNVFVFNDENPTAEVMARFLYDKFVGEFKACYVRLDKIRVWETPTCWAEYGEKI